MQFRQFVENQLNKTFYRVYCKPMYGGSASNPIGPGNYWTPRWDSVIVPYFIEISSK